MMIGGIKKKIRIKNKNKIKIKNETDLLCWPSGKLALKVSRVAWSFSNQMVLS